MKISISNFKAIKNIELFKIEQINILAGMNSGGKSSLIHFLLLIKQSLEARSTETPLKLNRPYVTLGKFENILRKEAESNTFSFSFFLDGNELTPRLRRIRIAEQNSQSSFLEFDSMTIFAGFKLSTDRIVVNEFTLTLTNKNYQLYVSVIRNSHGKSYMLRTNAGEIFFDYRDSPSLNDSASVQVNFYSFFPDYINSNGNDYFGSVLIDQARLSLQRQFHRISYIGPLREEPQDFYFQDDDLIEHIGNKGENAAYILAKHAKDKTSFVEYRTDENGQLAEIQKETTFEEAVNYWMCNIFQLGKELKVETSKSNRYLYTVSIVSIDGIKVPITHVGFGVSQIFPILVEGLRPNRKLVILEQPEIHLHPRVQSLLLDFVMAVRHNTSFLIETHSDHFITRLRRRIAESSTNQLVENTNLTFVEPIIGGVEYTRLNFNEIGILDNWPIGFFDQYESEMRSLVKAQAQKRKAQKQ